MNHNEQEEKLLLDIVRAVKGVYGIQGYEATKKQVFSITHEGITYLPEIPLIQMVGIAMNFGISRQVINSTLPVGDGKAESKERIRVLNILNEEFMALPVNGDAGIKQYQLKQRMIISKLSQSWTDSSLIKYKYL